MNMQTIGENAGRIWNLLQEKGSMSPTAISKSLGLRTTEVERAVGWLAREDKLLFEQLKTKGVKISLKN